MSFPIVFFRSSDENSSNIYFSEIPILMSSEIHLEVASGNPLEIPPEIYPEFLEDFIMISFLRVSKSSF